MKNAIVVDLRPRERVCQDAEPIATIYRNLGTTSAEQVVTRALTELAIAMAGLAEQIRTHDLHDLARRLRSLQSMAQSLGMVSLAHVTVDLGVCIDRKDTTAFAAVWARLLRIAEKALTAEEGVVDRTIP
ncbi:MAG: hypothetical protein ACEQSU_13565 [Microgenomates group bacterium]